MQRIAGLFQLAELYEPLGSWVVGLGQEVVNVTSLTGLNSKINFSSQMQT
jgi:hypothetical protein